ncbi:Regulator of carotenoid biosynthesis; Transcriptional regulator, PpsR [Rhodovastum atsumiense]|uniref:Transcriptional regulator PpsR n=1 Tax=Rhodovastum atsumiense TaxID=504468 RepID=A0A5M6IX49_9PROT|nr:transcriptional regulator PpsR [Rhodovastum atsumiense]KAA5612910.1 transcriptional regulator PpsR [Rhodovastum atsumiense]CAH2601007.1 Regulator of carotenoid biosynthesis; Transcriptional regulator, PpsR [Rhodovastum atsumiense]
MKAFKAPNSTLGNLNAEAAATLIAAAADVSLILDEVGVIRDMAFHSDDLARELEGATSWIGRRWGETVTAESRAKVDSALRDAVARATPRWRHINHAAPSGEPVPILYSVVWTGTEGQPGRVVAFGRDLRAISNLQQRLVDAQQAMERDYSRLRHAEMRYRLLFELSSEAVMIVDALSQRVTEANPAARELFGETAKRLPGRGFGELFDAESGPLVRELLSGVRASGRADEMQARLGEQDRDVLVRASLFRQESSAFFLIRLVLVAEEAETPQSRSRARLLTLVEHAPDGFVVTSPDGRVLAANAAFLDMAQLATEDRARGEPLERWLGRPGIETEVLLANLRQHGSVRLFATHLRGEYGADSEVEVSAIAVPNGGSTCYGFAIRNISHRLADTKPGRELPRSVEQLTELVGRVSLKDLVRETTDVIERLCIEAALEMTNDNRASAAEMLGLSRQSLYSKLRRYGLGELDAESGNEE